MDPSRKEAIFERDQWYCQIAHLIPGECDRGLTVHHRCERENGGSDRKDNLISLCRRHHDIIHGMDKSMSKGWTMVARHHGYLCDIEPTEPMRVIPRPGNVEPMAKAAPSVPGRKAAEKAVVRQLLAQPLIPKTPPPGHRPGTKDTRMTETNIDTIADEIERTLSQRGGVTPEALQNLLPFATDAAQCSMALTTLFQQERAELEYVGGVVRWCPPKERTVAVAADQDDVSDILLTVEAMAHHQLEIGRHIHGLRPLLVIIIATLAVILFFMAKGTIII